jgi:hypothetical protein
MFGGATMFCDLSRQIRRSACCSAVIVGYSTHDAAHCTPGASGNSGGENGRCEGSGLATEGAEGTEKSVITNFAALAASQLVTKARKYEIV